MSKRARYDGPHQEVAVYDPQGSVYDPPVAVVQIGHWLPEDVPARIRNDLTSSPDSGWTEINAPDQNTPKASDAKKDDA
jgi:hypothetical protein